MDPRSDEKAAAEFWIPAGEPRWAMAQPTAAMRTVEACMRVLPVMAMGPTVRLIFWILGSARTAAERLATRARMSSGLQ